MKNVIHFVLVFSVCLGYAFGPQKDSKCKVLLDDLVGTYEGGCKKGLAYGKGKAEGKDIYEGEFKKGLPHGSGTYIWADGRKYVGEWIKGKMDGPGLLTYIENGEEKEKEGYWKFGYYTGTSKNIKLYDVKLKKYINNYSVQRKGDGNSIGFQWVRGSRTLYSAADLKMTSNSGIETSDVSFSGYREIEFPTNIRLEFTNTDLQGTFSFDCIFEIDILVPGDYIVVFKD